MKSQKLFKFIIAIIVVLVLVKASLLFDVFSSLEEVFKGYRFNAESLFRLVIMILLVYAFCNLINLIISIIPIRNNRGKTMMTILQSFISYAAVIFAICFGLNLLGVDVSTIVASLGIVALVIGFGAESLIADVITGLFMIIENQYNVNDIVEVDGFRGTVSKIGIRTTSIVDAGGNVKIINNSNMKDILNRSDISSKAVSSLQVSYETDIEKMEEKMPAMMKAIHGLHPDLFKKEPEYLGVASLDDSGVTLKFVVEVDEKNIYQAQRVLNRELLVSFKKNGIEIPYPQLDIHQK
ncbi:MAG: mechanosensitive ion channel family protein [Erysipelotrichaceae bacterium]|nr:mechanosensitive ion channel family protein [Erysipelotrichaceae bacterium]